MDRPIRRSRFNRRMLIRVCLLLAGAVIVGLLLLRPTARTLRVDASKITISRVTIAPFHDFIALRGQVVPLGSVVLDAVLGGRVEAVFAEAGQRVVAGQRLIQLSDPTLELDAIARETQVIEQINSQRSLELNFAQVRTADANAVADAEYNILRLGREELRRQSVAAKGYMARQALDEITDELGYQKRRKAIAEDAQNRDAIVIARSEAMIRETAARLDANLAAAKRQLDALMIGAPVDGVLIALDAHVGEEKTRGQNLGRIDRDGGFKVTAPIDEFYLARVKLGQKVAISIDGTPSVLTVSKIYPQVKDGKFDVDLAWDGAPPPGLKRGEAVQGNLETGGDVSALVLPAGPFLNASGGAWVFVVGANGAERRSVKLGRRTAKAVEVLSGLRAGDLVVTSDYTGFDRIDRLTIAH